MKRFIQCHRIINWWTWTPEPALLITALYCGGCKLRSLWGPGREYEWVKRAIWRTIGSVVDWGKLENISSICMREPLLSSSHCGQVRMGSGLLYLQIYHEKQKSGLLCKICWQLS